MQIPQNAVLLRIFIGENDKFEGHSLGEAIVLKARENHLAGATLLRGPQRAADIDDQNDAPDRQQRQSGDHKSSDGSLAHCSCLLPPKFCVRGGGGSRRIAGTRFACARLSRDQVRHS